jgi:hypothetical protein
VNISDLTNVTTSKPEILFLIPEVLMKMTTESKNLRAMYGNYTSCLASHGDDGLSSKFLQSIYRSVLALVNQKKYTVLNEFLEATLLQVIKSDHLQVSTDEVFAEIFATMSALARIFNLEPVLLKTSIKLTESLQDILTKNDHKSCNGILNKLFVMCSEGKFDAESIKILDSKHFKIYKTKDASLLIQRITMFASKFINMHINKMEQSVECFSAFHYLTANFYQVFRTLESKVGTYPCCQDVKRHETHNMMITLYSYATKCVKNRKFSGTFAKQLIYHAAYDSQVCSEIKCKEGKSLLWNTYNYVFNVIFELNTQSSLVSANIKETHELIKLLFKIWNSFTADDRKDCSDPYVLILNVYGDASSKSTAKYICNGLASLLYHILSNNTFVSASKEKLKVIMKCMNTLHTSSKLLGFKSATEFLESKDFEGPKFSSNQPAPGETIAVEISAIFRYTPSTTSVLIGELYSKLFQESKDPLLIAKASQSVTDVTVKTMNLDEFKKINKFLDKSLSSRHDIEISLALALNNYSIYFLLFEATSEELKKDVVSAMAKISLKSEMEQLSYLNESLRHFTDVVHHIMQNPQDVKIIISMKRTLSILNNMASQYFVRGIKYKDFEAYGLLWHLLEIEKQPSNDVMLLNIGVIFLDHHKVLLDSSGNYIKTSKKLKQLKLDEVLVETNKAVDSFIATFHEQPNGTQASVLSYLLSIWIHYVSKGRKSDGFKRYDQFKELWMETSLEDGSATKETIRAKIYFCLVDLNVNCFNRSADNFMSVACGNLMNVKTIDRDFIFQFYQIYHRFTSEAINYSMNRQADMSHYDSVMLNMSAAAVRKGYSLKVLEILSLSILRHLNMEKVDQAKVRE